MLAQQTHTAAGPSHINVKDLMWELIDKPAVFHTETQSAGIKCRYTTTWEENGLHAREKCFLGCEVVTVIPVSSV